MPCGISCVQWNLSRDFFYNILRITIINESWAEKLFSYQQFKCPEDRFEKFFGIYVNFFISVLWAKKISPCPEISAKSSKLIIHVMKKTLRRYFQIKSLSPSIKENFHKNLPKRLWKTTETNKLVQRKIVMKKTSRKQVRYWKTFRNRKTIFSVVFSELHSTCSEEHFEEKKHVLWKKNRNFAKHFQVLIDNF